MSHDPGGGVIRITKEEALDSHVDDLLKRQMSLRGEPGVTRDHGRRWYYQNWFVFMLVGLMGAFAAWAILEPGFDDTLYLQGAITELDATDKFPALEGEELPKELDFVFHGSVTINKQKVYLPRGIKEIQPDGSKQRLDFSTLKEGQNIGLYVDYEEGRDLDLAVAEFVVPNPPPQKPSRAQKTLQQLSARSSAVGFVIFALVAGMIGLFVGAADGLVCRLPRRALICGGVGLLVGLVGGLLGGLFFDPIDLILLGPEKPSAHWSRLIGFALIGASVGGMIGVVELLARDAWLRMTQGPLTGKEFLIFKEVMNIGASPRSDIYLFNDPLVADHHATIRASGDTCEIEARQTQQPLLINNRSVTRSRLRHGDSVTIGRTVFVFQQRKS